MISSLKLHKFNSLNAFFDRNNGLLSRIVHFHQIIISLIHLEVFVESWNWRSTDLRSWGCFQCSVRHQLHQISVSHVGQSTWLVVDLHFWHWLKNWDALVDVHHRVCNWNRLRCSGVACCSISCHGCWHVLFIIVTIIDLDRFHVATWNRWKHLRQVRRHADVLKDPRSLLLVNLHHFLLSQWLNFHLALLNLTIYDFHLRFEVFRDRWLYCGWSWSVVFIFLIERRVRFIAIIGFLEWCWMMERKNGKSWCIKLTEFDFVKIINFFDFWFSVFSENLWISLHFSIVMKK